MEQIIHKQYIYQRKWNNIYIPIYIFDSDGKYKDVIGNRNDFPTKIPPDMKTIPPNIVIKDPTFLMYFTQENVAHSMCQLIRSIYEYNLYGQGRQILISECVIQMPFIYNLINVLLPNANIYYMNNSVLFYAEDVYIPKYIWFTEIISYESMYDKLYDKNVRILHTDGDISPEYKDLYEPLKYFDLKIQELCLTHQLETPVKNIFMIKSTKTSNSITPGRAIELTDDVDDVLAKNDYKTALTEIPNTKEAVIQHILTLRNAENILTSYGGANCSNRFFFNPDAIVKVICNTHYASEYNNEWHPRCSAYRAKQYIFVLDMPNTLSGDDIERVIEYKE